MANVKEARSQLSQAIALHEKHMSGRAPTTGADGAKSQMLMMTQMKAALSALGDSEIPPMAMSRALRSKRRE